MEICIKIWMLMPALSVAAICVCGCCHNTFLAYQYGKRGTDVISFSFSLFSWGSFSPFLSILISFSLTRLVYNDSRLACLSLPRERSENCLHCTFPRLCEWLSISVYRKKICAQKDRIVLATEIMKKGTRRGNFITFLGTLTGSLTTVVEVFLVLFCYKTYEVT